ncbi:MAG: RluA family pseudouridine synthase [Ignavibacteriae bacterium]|nr:RluA family pseudouridine synthase [Ignavibacteriota bacterium]
MSRPNYAHTPIDHEPEERERMSLVVPAKQSRERLDVYLTHQVENATRNKVQQAIEAGYVLVNGKRVKPSHPITPGEVIEITFQRPPRRDAVPENIHLDIVYEDDELLVVNKPAGMVTHPAYGNYTGTLVNALLYHTAKLSTPSADLRPGIVHRLDKDTSGLLVVAKTDAAHHTLAKQFAKRTIDREYWAIVWGRFRQRKGTIEASLGRSKRDRKKVAVTADGKHAVTEYEVMKAFGFLSLVRLKLKTGRTHQIRAHLVHIGHPVFGDPTYGGRSSEWGGLRGSKVQRAQNLLDLITRQALHAKTIGFIHPKTKQTVKFDSELPEDMKQVLEKLG